MGWIGDSFGATEVFVHPEYQKQGIGVELLAQYDKQAGKPKLGGQSTTAGENMRRAYHKKQVTEALHEGKTVPEEVLKDYPGIQKPTTLKQPAWHGSPHIFDEFKLHNIGTGEGHQAYGWGLYFAGSKDVAGFYRDQLAGTDVVTYKGKEWDEISLLERADERLSETGKKDFEAYALVDYLSFKGDIQAALRHYAKQIKDRSGVGIKSNSFQEGVMKALMKLDTKQLSTKKPGRTYKVDIPEDSEFLDWDKPLEEMPEKTQKAITAYAKESGFPVGGGQYSGEKIYKEIVFQFDSKRKESDPSARESASRKLAELGVPGLRFFRPRQPKQIRHY